MRAASLLLCLLLLAAPLSAQTEPDRYRWTPTNTVLTVASTALIVADWSTTLTIARNTGWMNETNPLLPRRPPEWRVNLQCAAALAGHLWLTPKLPHPYRDIVLVAVTALELDAVVTNIRRADRHQLVIFALPF